MFFSCRPGDGLLTGGPVGRRAGLPLVSVGCNPCTVSELMFVEGK